MSRSFAGLGGGKQRGSPRSADERLFRVAAEVMGTTGYEPEAGYILPDGTLLDFSGKREGGDPGERAMDHREIAQVYDEAKVKWRGEPDGYSDAMIDFIRRGAIRIDVRDGFASLDMQDAPTSAQWRVIEGILRDWKPETTAIDVQNDDGNTAASHELEGREARSAGTVREVVRDLIARRED